MWHFCMKLVLMQWMFVCTVCTDGLVLWHRGISCHSAEYAQVSAVYGLTHWGQVMHICRAGVLVLSTRTHSTRVLNFWYSYCTHTSEFQSHSTRTRGPVLRYSYEYWHEYWYSMVHLRCKGENHHTFEINSIWLTIKVKFQIDLLCYNLNIWYMGCDYKFHTFFQFYHHWKINRITIFM